MWVGTALVCLLAVASGLDRGHWHREGRGDVDQSAHHRHHSLHTSTSTVHHATALQREHDHVRDVRDTGVNFAADKNLPAFVNGQRIARDAHHHHHKNNNNKPCRCPGAKPSFLEVQQGAEAEVLMMCEPERCFGAHVPDPQHDQCMIAVPPWPEKTLRQAWQAGCWCSDNKLSCRTFCRFTNKMQIKVPDAMEWVEGQVGVMLSKAPDPKYGREQCIQSCISRGICLDKPAAEIDDEEIPEVFLTPRGTFTCPAGGMPVGEKECGVVLPLVLEHTPGNYTTVNLTAGSSSKCGTATTSAPGDFSVIPMGCSVIVNDVEKTWTPYYNREGSTCPTAEYQVVCEPRPVEAAELNEAISMADATFVNMLSNNGFPNMPTNITATQQLHSDDVVSVDSVYTPGDEVHLLIEGDVQFTQSLTPKEVEEVKTAYCKAYASSSGIPIEALKCFMAGVPASDTEGTDKTGSKFLLGGQAKLGHGHRSKHKHKHGHGHGHEEDPDKDKDKEKDKDKKAAAQSPAPYPDPNEKTAASTGTHYAFGSPISLACPEKHVIKVTSAMHGKNCASQSGYNEKLANITKVVGEDCDDEGTCEWEAEAQRWEDPCPKCNKTIEIKYVCHKEKVEVHKESKQEYRMAIEATSPIMCTCLTPGEKLHIDAVRNKYVCTDQTEGFCNGDDICFSGEAWPIQKKDTDGCHKKGQVNCVCDHPGSLSVGSNTFMCDDGNRAACPSGQYCNVNHEFLSGSFGGCMPVPPPTSEPTPPRPPCTQRTVTKTTDCKLCPAKWYGSCAASFPGSTNQREVGCSLVLCQFKCDVQVCD